MMGALTPNCKKHSGAALLPLLQRAEGSLQRAAVVRRCLRGWGAHRWTQPPTPLSLRSGRSPTVTLFEGGRVYGTDVINELIAELHASVEMSAGFEGEMRALADYAR